MDEDGNWFGGLCECRICGHRWVGAWPAEADPDNLQCPHCEHMTGEAIGYEEGDDAAAW